MVTPTCSSRVTMRSVRSPGLDRPARSPLTSAMNTGTPSCENPSASTCRVTVFPVPVAPEIMPCRLAILGSRHTAPSALVPTHILLFSSIFCSPFV